MAELSLCIGTMAKTPYYISGLGVNVYSIEELCYCLVDNAYILDSEFVNKKLCDFVENQLDLKDLGSKLRQLVKEDKSLGEFVTTILEETEYLSEEEIKDVKQILLDNAMLGFARKRKARGDNLLKTKKYTLAIEEYQYVLQNIDKAEETELYGALLHNIGTAYAHMFLFEKAAYYYKEAADLTDNEESMIQYLMALRLTMRKDEYNRLMLRYGFEEEFVKKIDDRMAESRYIAEHSPYTQRMDELRNMKTDGKISEYYDAIDETVNSWKQEYRKNMTVRSV